MLTGDELLAKVKELRPPEEKKEPTITKEQLDQLWNALEYTRATISGGKDVMGKLDCFAIHKGRAHQSYEYLKKSIDIVNQLKKELQ
jgi:hypothetical protein